MGGCILSTKKKRGRRTTLVLRIFPTTSNKGEVISTIHRYLLSPWVFSQEEICLHFKLES
jgi:hypothetical protein